MKARKIFDIFQVLKKDIINFGHNLSATLYILILCFPTSEMGNGKKLVNEYCMNNYGFTCTSSVEGNALKCKAVFWKVSPR